MGFPGFFCFPGTWRIMKALSFYFFLSSFSSLSNMYCSSTHTKALVSNHQLDPIQATAAEPLEEADPAGFVLFHAFGGAKNLTVSVLIHRDRHQNGHIFKLSGDGTSPFPAFGAGRFRPRRHTDSVRLAEGGFANPQYGHTLSCSAR